jgi:hypothetical protein
MYAVSRDEYMNLLQTNATQWQLLTDINRLFTQSNIDFWLRGGWALDFLLGEVTREHSDIDLVTWKKHAAIVKQLLSDNGYTFQRDIGAQMDFTKSDQDISVVYIGINPAGQISPPDIPDWIWLDGVLDYPPQHLNGLRCCVLSPQQLLDNKLSYQSAKGTPLRAKDELSIEQLRKLIKSLK